MSYSVKKKTFIKQAFMEKSIVLRIFLAIFDAFGLMHVCVCGGREGLILGRGRGRAYAASHTTKLHMKRLNKTTIFVLLCCHNFRKQPFTLVDFYHEYVLKHHDRVVLVSALISALGLSQPLSFELCLIQAVRADKLVIIYILQISMD